MIFETKSLEGRPGQKRRYHLCIVQEDVTGLRSENGCLLAYFIIITVCNSYSKCTTYLLGTIVRNLILLRGGNTCFKSFKYKTE